MHEAAPHSLPPFIPTPDGGDFLSTFVICLLIVVVLLVGVFYFKLHALPEHMAHRSQSTQMQLVGVLCLLALFTHNNVFWVIALLIAALRVPDLLSPLRSAARSLAALAGRSREAEAEMAETPAEAAHDLHAPASSDPARVDVAEEQRAAQQDREPDEEGIRAAPAPSPANPAGQTS